MFIQNSNTKNVSKQVKIKKERKFIGWPAIRIINRRRRMKKARNMFNQMYAVTKL